MSEQNILLPSKPKIIKEEENKGTYQIDGLYPGYGHTLGNSLRRIILSSLPGNAVTAVEIEGVDHEFSTIDGVKEDVIRILLNLKKLKIKILSDDENEQVLTLKAKGVKSVTAGDIDKHGQVEILNPELEIATLTTPKSSLDMKITVKRGLGYKSKEDQSEERTSIGKMILDATFSPIRRVSYDVENMRVGDRTDFNRLLIFVETDGVISPKDAFEKSIEIMIKQLSAIIGFEEKSAEISEEEEEASKENKEEGKSEDTDFLKTRIDSLNLSLRTSNALSAASIRTVGGLIRKSEDDLLDIEGLGSKGIQEIKRALSDFGVILKKSE